MNSSVQQGRRQMNLTGQGYICTTDVLGMLSVRKTVVRTPE